MKIGARILRAALNEAYEAGQYAPTDTYAEGLKIAMAPSPKQPPKKG